MSYAALRNKKVELIRKARDGSVYVGPYSTLAITALTDGGIVSEVQTVVISGSPTGGTYTLTFNGQTTGAIAYNANAATVEAALEALSNLAPADVTVTGAAPTYTVTFGGVYAGLNVPQMTTTPSLTGGTSPTVTVNTTTQGDPVDLKPLPTGMKDVGWMTTAGASYGRQTEVSNVNSFGSVEPTRSDVTRDTITMGISMQETNLTSLGLYTGADLSALTADAGSGEVRINKPARPGFRYYRVLGLFVDDGDDGEIYIGRYLPRARVTEFAEQAFTDGDEAITYGVTFTGYEDSVLGFSHQWLFGGPGWLALLDEMGISMA